MAFYLGLTGGIASGKSTIADLFLEKGITVIDADKIAHFLMEKGQANWQNIVDNFGVEYLTAEQEIDRKKLGKLVFNDPEKLQQLNRASSKAIRAEIKSQMDNHQNEKFVVVDIPLLFEGHFEEQLDAVLVVDITEEIQLQRLKKRNNLTEQEAKNKMKSQMPLIKKRQLANYLIDNTGTIEETKILFGKLFDEKFSHIWRD